jgi:hypothetical protein
MKGPLGNFITIFYRPNRRVAMKIVMKLPSSACTSENQSFSARFHTYPTFRGIYCEAVRVAWPAGFSAWVRDNNPELSALRPPGSLLAAANGLDVRQRLSGIAFTNPMRRQEATMRPLLRRAGWRIGG